MKLIPFLDDFFNVVFFSKETESHLQGEIILKHCTKADGIIKVVNHFKGKMKDTIAFGDSMNDYQCRIQRITGTYPDTWKEA